MSAREDMPAEAPLDFLPFDQLEIGGMIAEAMMARREQNIASVIHQAMQGSSHVGLGFIMACNKRLAAP